MKSCFQQTLYLVLGALAIGVLVFALLSTGVLTVEAGSTASKVFFTTAAAISALGGLALACRALRCDCSPALICAWLCSARCARAGCPGRPADRAGGLFGGLLCGAGECGRRAVPCFPDCCCWAAPCAFCSRRPRPTAAIRAAAIQTAATKTAFEPIKMPGALKRTGHFYFRLIPYFPAGRSGQIPPPSKGPD